MKLLFVPALLCLALAGCTSSEPQGLVAPVPAMGAVAASPAAPSFNATGAYGGQPASADRMPAMASAAATVTSSAGFPPPPVCASGAPCAAPARIEKCRTVGSVTTCDVPPDPTADSTNYTN